MAGSVNMVFLGYDFVALLNFYRLVPTNNNCVECKSAGNLPVFSQFHYQFPAAGDDGNTINENKRPASGQQHHAQKNEA